VGFRPYKSDEGGYPVTLLPTEEEPGPQDRAMRPHKGSNSRLT
jgi:hypothetical protein